LVSTNAHVHKPSTLIHLLPYVPHVRFLCLSFHSSLAHRDLHSFPTRRSSDLLTEGYFTRRNYRALRSFTMPSRVTVQEAFHHHRDRKSTRLNSNHVSISYAVFCLKKKKKKKQFNKFRTYHTPRPNITICMTTA